jgi:hypothetical protein
MRIALLLCGQMRTFDHPKVIEYTNRLIEKFDCDVFVSTWNNRGVSLWTTHSQPQNIYKDVKDLNIDEKSISIIPNIRDYIISDYDEYVYNKCNPTTKQLLINNQWGVGASSSPQLYTMHLASEMKKKYEKDNNFIYDVVIKSRPDFLQLHNDIEKYFDKLENTCYHINTGISYSPNRVYDIFFMSNSEVMNIICDSWKKYDELVNSIGQYDPCQLLYAQCMVNDINVVSFDKVLGDVLRLENYLVFDYTQSFENMYL